MCSSIPLWVSASTATRLLTPRDFLGVFLVQEMYSCTQGQNVSQFESQQTAVVPVPFPNNIYPTECEA